MRVIERLPQLPVQFGRLAVAPVRAPELHGSEPEDAGRALPKKALFQRVPQVAGNIGRGHAHEVVQAEMRLRV